MGGNMRNRFALFAVLVALAAFPAQCWSTTSEPAGVLGVALHPQETGMWCWAASAQMVMHYLGTNVPQCVQANNRFGRRDCCSITRCPNPISGHPCVTGGWPEFFKYGFRYATTSNIYLTWQQIRNEIDHNRPFCFSWHWPGGGGHMMVVSGYTTIRGVNYVRVLDPWSPCRGEVKLMTYSYFCNSPGHHTHWDDYYGVGRR
jgi:hypothetical protein